MAIWASPTKFRSADSQAFMIDIVSLRSFATRFVVLHVLERKEVSGRTATIMDVVGCVLIILFVESVKRVMLVSSHCILLVVVNQIHHCSIHHHTPLHLRLHSRTRPHHRMCRHPKGLHIVIFNFIPDASPHVEVLSRQPQSL